MARLRKADPSGPGIERRRRGRGFEYFDQETGEKVDEDFVLERISALAVPPAWKEVWICADEMGHLQAIGIDAAGRKQYLYHQRWRERRDQEKFDRMLRLARVLPSVRIEVEKQMLAAGAERGRSSPARSVSSTGDSSGSAARTTPRPTRPTDSRPSRKNTSPSPTIRSSSTTTPREGSTGVGR